MKQILITLVLLVLACGATEEPFHPTESQWEYAIGQLQSDRVNHAFFANFDLDSSHTELDYLDTNGMWYSAIFSRRDENHGVHAKVVGYYNRVYKIAWQCIFPTRTVMDEQSLRRYEHLKDVDSLWSLFQPNDFRKDSLSYAKLWEYATKGQWRDRTGSDSWVKNAWGELRMPELRPKEK